MKKMMFLLAAVLAYAMPSAVSAIDVEGFYVAGLGAANWLSTNKHHHHRYNVGWAAGGMIGYRWCQGWRLEAEATYRNNQARRHNARHYYSWSFMANGYYDFADFGCCMWDITPYVDAGIGYTTERVGRRHRSGGTYYNRHHRKNGFAWQVGAGLAYPIWECAEIALDYRFHKGRAHKFYNNTLGAVLRWYF